MTKLANDFVTKLTNDIVTKLVKSLQILFFIFPFSP